MYKIRQLIEKQSSGAKDDVDGKCGIILEEFGVIEIP